MSNAPTRHRKLRKPSAARVRARNLLAGLALALAPAASAATTTVLDGDVIDAETKGPVANATSSCTSGQPGQGTPQSIPVGPMGRIVATVPGDAPLLTCDVGAPGYTTVRISAKRNASGTYVLGKLKLHRALVGDPIYTATNFTSGGVNYLKLDFVIRNTGATPVSIRSLRVRLVVPGTSCMASVPDVIIQSQPAGQVAQDLAATSTTAPWQPSFVVAPFVVNGAINECRDRPVDIDVAYLLALAAATSIRVALLVPASLRFTTAAGSPTLKLEADPNGAGEVLAEVAPDARVGLLRDVRRTARAY